jgi:S1-C subfamily serine protease
MRKKYGLYIIVFILICSLLCGCTISINSNPQGQESGNADSSENQVHSVTSKPAITPEPTDSILPALSNAKAVLYLELYNRSHSIIGSGSGFLVDGKLITNYHVIVKTYEIVVWNSDHSRSTTAKTIYSYDEIKDIAVLELENRIGVESLLLGDSDQVSQGDKVYAVGYPLGIANTFSDGLVSSRYIGTDGVDYIQITTPISPGSSGGALFDEAGLVVGITCASYKDGQNLNLAIASNQITPLLKQTSIKLSLSDHYASHSPFEQLKAYLIEHGEDIIIPDWAVEYYMNVSFPTDYEYEIVYTDYSTTDPTGISMRLDDVSNFSIDYKTGRVSGIFTFCKISFDLENGSISVSVCTTDGFGNDNAEAVSDSLSIDDLLNGNVSFNVSVWDKGYTKDSYRAIAQNMLELTISYSDVWLSENLGFLVADLAD